jgi:SAM-dependent methyltransferase
MKMQRPDQIPTTGRKAAFLAKQLGYASVSEFAKSLPKGAVVLDVGAGISRLGHEVARARPDVAWTNIDPGYTYANIRAIADRDRPTNLRLLTDDIVQGSEGLEALNGKADLLFSYWLLPHLSVESDEPARAAIQHMLEILKPGGKLVVGPVKQLGFGFLSPFRYKGTRTYEAGDEAAVADIVAATKLWWLPRLIQRYANRCKIHIASRVVGGTSKR